jgi:hypothetical protein
MYHAMFTSNMERMPCGGVALGFGKHVVDVASVLVIWTFKVLQQR